MTITIIRYSEKDLLEVNSSQIHTAWERANVKTSFGVPRKYMDCSFSTHKGKAAEPSLFDSSKKGLLYNFGFHPKTKK